jgi:DNA polymerase III epsilon subunit-like protein
MNLIKRLLLPKWRRIVETGSYYKGLARVKCEDGSYNFIDGKKHFLFKKGFVEAEEFLFDCVIADHQLYNTRGKIAVRGYADVINGTDEWIIVYAYRESENGALVSHNGTVLSSFEYTSIKYSMNHFLAFCQREETDWVFPKQTRILESWYCFLDRDGQEESFRYATMPNSPKRVDIDEKLSLVSIYLDRKEYPRDPCRYCTCLINRENNQILLRNCAYVKELQHIVFGRLTLKNCSYPEDQDSWTYLKGVWSVNNSAMLIPPVYEDITPDLNQGFYITRTSYNKYGLYDCEGKVLIEPKYDKLIIPDIGYCIFVESKQEGIGIANPDTDFHVHWIVKHDIRKATERVVLYDKEYRIQRSGRLYFSIFQDEGSQKKGLVDEYLHIILPGKYESIDILPNDIIIAKDGINKNRFFLEDLENDWRERTGGKLNVQSYPVDLTQAEYDNLTFAKGIKKAHKFLFFDTETSGLPKDFNAPFSDYNNWPRLLQLSWIITDNEGKELERNDLYVKPEGFSYIKPEKSPFNVSGEELIDIGKSISEVLNAFRDNLLKVDYIVGHNIQFDMKVLRAELIRGNEPDCFDGIPTYCTMIGAKAYYAQPCEFGFKYPKLQELYNMLFHSPFDDAHNAISDVLATKKCFFEMKRRNMII